jgi:hypothetical protein
MRQRLLAVSVRRRHLTPGQRAMLYAIAYPEPAKRGGRADRASMFGDRTLKRERLSLARTVLHAAPDWVDLVFHGSRAVVGTAALIDVPF